MVDILNEIIGCTAAENPLEWTISAAFIFAFICNISYVIRALIGYDN